MINIFLYKNSYISDTKQIAFVHRNIHCTLYVHYMYTICTLSKIPHETKSLVNLEFIHQSKL